MLRQALGPAVHLVVPGIRAGGRRGRRSGAHSQPDSRPSPRAPTGSLWAGRSPRPRDPGHCGGGRSRRACGDPGSRFAAINDPIGFDTAVEAGADWLGFNFFPPSPRVVTPAQAAALSGRRMSGGPLRVGLIRRPDRRSDRRNARCGDIWTSMQVYGRRDRSCRDRGPVSPAGVASGWRCRIRPTCRARRWAGTRCCWRPKPPADGDAAPAAMPCASTGRSSPAWTAPAPWLLAGGLTPDNVAAAIQLSGRAGGGRVHPGSNSTKGRKDPALIRAFIRSRRSAACDRPVALTRVPCG